MASYKFYKNANIEIQKLTYILGNCSSKLVNNDLKQLF